MSAAELFENACLMVLKYLYHYIYFYSYSKLFLLVEFLISSLGFHFAYVVNLKQNESLGVGGTSIQSTSQYFYGHHFTDAYTLMETAVGVFPLVVDPPSLIATAAP